MSKIKYEFTWLTLNKTIEQVTISRSIMQMAKAMSSCKDINSVDNIHKYTFVSVFCWFSCCIVSSRTLNQQTRPPKRQDLLFQHAWNYTHHSLLSLFPLLLLFLQSFKRFYRIFQVCLSIKVARINMTSISNKN